MKKYLTILFLILKFLVQAQAINAKTDTMPTITGIVVDVKQMPIISATVILLKTQNGVVTNAQGKFTLKPKVKASTYTIRVSGVGLKKQDLQIQEKDLEKTIKVVMQNADEKDEVIIFKFTCCKPPKVKLKINKCATDSLINGIY